MAGLIASLIAAFLVMFTDIAFSELYTTLLFLFGGLFLYYLYSLAQASSLSAIQKMQQNQTPFSSDILNKDPWLTYSNAYLSVFVIFSIYLIFDTIIKNAIGIKGALALWLIGFGLGTWILSKSDERLRSYFSPFFLIDRFYTLGNKAISQDKDKELLNHIDALSEIACNAIEHVQPSLSITSAQSIRKLSKDYLTAAKSLGHTEKREPNSEDPVIFMLFYIFQRYEMINDYAIWKSFEPVIASIVTSLGEMTIDAAKYDISLAIYPILETGKIASKAEKNGFKEIGDKATLTLLESGRRILKEIDVSYLELKETFFALISQIENISKEAFRQDKNVNIELLIHPFNILLNFFKDEKLANHKDTPIIVSDIKRVLNEFQQLELILKTMPPLPTIEEASPIEESEEEEQSK